MSCPRQGCDVTCMQNPRLPGSTYKSPPEAVLMAALGNFNTFIGRHQCNCCGQLSSRLIAIQALQPQQCPGAKLLCKAFFNGHAGRSSSRQAAALDAHEVQRSELTQSRASEGQPAHRPFQSQVRSVSISQGLMKGSEGPLHQCMMLLDSAVSAV